MASRATPTARALLALQGPLFCANLHMCETALSALYLPGALKDIPQRVHSMVSEEGQTSVAKACMEERGSRIAKRHARMR
eukprot:11379762-Alexandrium_andersonii.AAC.1